MPLRQITLALSADPRAAHEARQWIAAKLGALGRPELVDAARLGVSELVSNAILHGCPPMSVTLAGTAAHPRVEVADGSRRPPRPPWLMRTAGPSSDPDELLATVGRGLALVAMSSSAWGAILEDWGKVVWFEPVAEPTDDAPAPQLHDSRLPDTRCLVAADSEQTVAVKVSAVPIDLFLGTHRRYTDLRRELRLLSLAHQDHYPMAGSLTDAFAQFEQMIPVGVIRQVEAARAIAADVTDVHAHISEAAPPVFEQMLEILDVADEFCRAQRLLSLARTSEQRAFHYWFLGEFVHQAAGAAPTAWTGNVPGTST